MEIDILKKNNNKIFGKISCTSDIYNLEEVQEVKDALQEHLLFLGLDNCNNVRTIKVIGIGGNSGIYVDSKDIIRTALITESNKVILVHNHPSDSLKPSMEDIHLSNITNKLLNVFNIKLLDHLIVTSEEYFSMEKSRKIDRKYIDDTIEYLDKALLLEENIKLKENVLEEKNFNYEEIEM